MSGIWKILKHREPALLPILVYVQVILLLVYNRSREIFGNAQETFVFTVEKTNTSVYVRNNLFTIMEEMIDSFL